MGFRPNSLYIYMYVYMYVCIYIHIYIYIGLTLTCFSSPSSGGALLSLLRRLPGAAVLGPLLPGDRHVPRGHPGHDGARAGPRLALPAPGLWAVEQGATHTYIDVYMYIYSYIYIHTQLYVYIYMYIHVLAPDSPCRLQDYGQ